MRERGWASRGGLILGLGMLPLVALVVWLALDQFQRQKAALLAELAALSAEQHHAVEQMLQGADRQLARMRLTVEAGGPQPLGLIPITAEAAGRALRGTGHSGTAGALIGVPDLDPQAPGLAGALAMLDVVEMEARLGTRSHWSYFFSARGDFITIHPNVTLGDIAGAASTPPDSVADLVAYWLGYEVFRLGTPQANPRRLPYWTPVYEDAGGARLMVSHGAPVWDGDRFLGIVGTDVRLGTFQEVLSHLRQPVGFLAILDASGEVLGIDGASFGGDTDAMRAHLGAGHEAVDAPGFRRIGDDMVLSRPLAAALFRLVHVLPVAEMNAHLLPRFIGYGWILLGLLATMAGLLAILHRTYIRPGFALGAWVHGQVAGLDPDPPRLPSAWRAMLDRIAGAFAESRASRERLERSEARYRTVVNTQTEFVVRYSPDGHPRFANDAYCRYLNVPPEEITTREVSDFSYILPEDMAGHDAHLAALTPERPTKSITFRSILADGTFHWEEWNDTGIFDDRGRLAEIQAVGRDITERKLAEEALRQSEKMAAMGSLLAGVSHELNNPLAIVLGYAGMLRDMAPDEATRRRAGEIHRAAERCARIVKSFLAMARSRPAERVAVDLAEVIRDALDLAGYGLRSNGVQVALDAAPGLPPVLADRDQIHQVFMNLILNAQQAMMAMDGPRLLSIRIGAEGAMLAVTLADTGPGIDAAVQPRLFEPFFTTKPQGMGTGIGLSVCLRIVQAHGGTIRLEPGETGGAVARVELPVAEALAGDAPLAAAPHLPPARILVVDDEAGILGWIAEVLEAEGLAVTACNSGQAAQEALLAGDYGAVLTDLRMPGVSGERLVGFIAEHRPALLPRVLVMTGDAMGAEVALGPRVAMVLEKPLERGVLLAALARVLTTRETA